MSRKNFVRLRRHLEGDALSEGLAAPSPVIATPPRDHATYSPDHATSDLIIDEDEFFQPGFNYDFPALKETVTYYRGEEEYQRPCGWKRFAIKAAAAPENYYWGGNEGL